MAERAFGILVELKDRFTRPLRGFVAPIENAKRELKSLEQAGRELKWAEKYQDKLSRLQPSLQAARENQARLAEAMAATENPSRQLTREYEKATQKLAALEIKEREYTNAINQSREALRQAGVDTEDLSRAREQLADRTDQVRARTLAFHNVFKSVEGIRNTAKEYKTLAAHLMLVKTAMAAATAAAVGLAPHLAAVGAAYGMSLATFASTANIAAVSKELQGLSATTGANAQALQEWRLAARFEGIDTKIGEYGDMSKVFTDLKAQTDKIGTKEGKEFAASLKEIGLSAKSLKDQSPDVALLKIGEALDKSKLTQQQKTDFLSGISDDAGKLLPLLQKNSQAFAEIRDYANKVGAIQTPEQLERMKQTNHELSFWKLGLEGVQVRLSAVGSNVVNTLGPNVRQLFVDAQKPIAEWSAKVDVALKKFKVDWDNTGSLGDALKLSFKTFYPTLYGFLSGASAFGRGYGEAFINPMLDSLKAGYARIGEAMGSGGGIEAKGRALGELMRPMTAVIDEVSKALAFLIENFRYLKSVTDFTPLGVFVNHLGEIRAVLDFVGEGIKKLGQAFGLIDPNSTASGFTVLLGTLGALAAATLANKLALGAIGAAFSAVSFAVSPLISVFSVGKTVVGALIHPLELKAKVLARLLPWVERLKAGWLSTIAVLGRVGPFMIGIGTRIAGAFRAMGNAALWLGRMALPVVGRAILFVGRALLLNPIGLLITAIAAGGYLIYRNWSTIKPMLVSFWESVKAKWNGFLTWVSAMPAKIVGFFASLPGEMLEIGANIVNGLIDGIKAKWASAKEYVSGLASDVKGWFASPLGIQSPSRVFMGFGHNIGDGLTIGIAAKHKQAIAAARGLSDGVRKQMQTGVVVSLAEARKKRDAQQSALPQRETLANALSHRAGAGASKQEVGGEIRVRIDAPAGYNTSAKVSKPVGSKVGITANVGRMSW